MFILWNGAILWQCVLNKIDIIWNKIKMIDQSNSIPLISYVPVNPFLSMICKPNFILIAIPEETRANSWRQDRHKMFRYMELLVGIRKNNFLSLPDSCSYKDKSHLFFISSNEKWLSLTKHFWKIFQYSKCLAQYYGSFFFSKYQY